MTGIAEETVQLLSPQQLSELLSGFDAPSNDANRRNKNRRGFNCAMAFIPIGATGRPSTKDALRVMGKDISEAGLGFIHDRPLPSKRGVICFERPGAGKYAIEIAVLWTQEESTGSYESGCWMLRKAID